MVDIFEGAVLLRAASDGNYLMLDAAWKWLPKTAIFLNAQQGYIFYLNEAEATANNKVSSYPLLVTAGLRGLLTEKTSADARARVHERILLRRVRSTGGFWGSTYLDLSALPASDDAQPRSWRVTGTISERGRRVLLVQRDLLRLVRPADRGRLALDLSGRYAHRNYGASSSTRRRWSRIASDNFFQVGATLDYFIRNWVYAGVGYSLFSTTAATSRTSNT